MSHKNLFNLGCALWFVVAACDSEAGKAAPCTVKQLEHGITVTCPDGSSGTVQEPAGGSCTVAESGNDVTISCPDGSSVTIPGGSPIDAGSQSCSVSQHEDGSVTITCPDGSHATIPGAPNGDGGPAEQPMLIGATRAACGACHDSSAAEAHFDVMTTEVDGLPVETCGTCHAETSIEPITQVHARREFGPPGFVVEILGASIASDTRKPTVELSLRNTAGEPLTKDSTMSFTFLISKVETQSAVLDNSSIAGPYRNYINKSVTQQDNPDFPLMGDPRVVQQPSSESGSNGVFTNTGAGAYDYTFKFALPADYDAAATHVLATYVTRTVGAVRWVSNATHAFVPGNGAASVQTRAAVHTATCNGCHNPLSAHGGSRQEVQVCLGCHTQGAVDPESNESIDFNVMIHKIHMGAQLPRVSEGGKYAIVGYGNNTIDFSHVEYPRDILHCQSCHTDSDDDRWLINGTIEACTSCHENIYDSPADGMGGRHPFPLTGDPPSKCGNANCHGPGGNAPDVTEAHVTFLNTSSAGVLDVSILSVAVATPDTAPQVRIKALSGTRATGAVTPLTSVDQIAKLSVFLNGPNTGYLLNGHDIKTYLKADLVALAADAAKPGEFTFELPQTLAEAASGLGDPSVDSYTLSLRAAFDPTPGTPPDNDAVDMIENPTFAFTASEDGAVPRAAIADTAKCNSCHGDLSGHGGDILARSVDQCAMCHTASMDTVERQAANKVPGVTTSLRLSTMVHRIHAGDFAQDPFKAYGYAASAPYPVIDFSSREYPGDLRDCAKCHEPDTYLLPLPETALPSTLVELDAHGNVVGK